MSDSDAVHDRVRPMAPGDVATVFEWRNHPDVRRHMFSQHEINLDEHRRWFDSRSRDPSRHLLIYERHGAPLGFVALHLAAHGKVADWGFYAAPGAPKGTGRSMGQCALDHAFIGLALHKVCGQALQTNQRSIGFHLAMGFRQEGLMREQHFDGQHYQGVVCFGLLQREWTPASRA